MVSDSLYCSSNSLSLDITLRSGIHERRTSTERCAASAPQRRSALLDSRFDHGEINNHQKGCEPDRTYASICSFGKVVDHNHHQKSESHSLIPVGVGTHPKVPGEATAARHEQEEQQDQADDSAI